MNDTPNASELLAIARATFETVILRTLPDATRYTGLMIAAAMAIAQREIDAGDTAGRAEHERLCRLMSERHEAGAGKALQTALRSYNRRLAKEIRAGRFDGTRRADLFEHLRRTTEEKLAVSNPKALPSEQSKGQPGDAAR